MDTSLKKGIAAVFSANVINLVFNLLTNFLLPKYLSVESYASIKTFQLYTTYIGIFAFGCADGMYLRYGGKQLASIDERELKTGISSFRLFMCAESLILIPLSFVLGDKIIIAFVMTILSMNMANYYKNLYQSVGEFKRYSHILNWTTIANFAINMVLLFGLRTDTFFLYLMGYVIVNAVIWLVLERNVHNLINKRDSGKGSWLSIKLVVSDVKMGFLLMVGNFSNILLSSMDRWFVKALMDSAQFAYYSFAVSMEGFLNVAITPITTTLYNYFCNHMEVEDVVRVRRYVLLFSTVIVAAAFPAKLVIEVFLNNYYDSVNVLFILFATQILYVMIKGIYVNLYKASKKQNTYFARLVLILGVGAVLNYVFVQVYPYKEAFAVGTLSSAFIWLFLCTLDFKDNKFEIREWLYIIFEVFAFIICGIFFNSVIGLLVYIAFTVAMMRYLMNNEFKNSVRLVINTLYK